MAGKRTNYLSWDEYFMSIVSLSALKNIYDYSGVCIVDENNKILATGYDDMPQCMKTNFLKYFGLKNSTLSNALYTFRGRRQEFENGILYCSKFPDYDDSKKIVQSRLKKVIYLTKDVPKDVEEISRKILSCGNVKIEPYYDDLYSKKEYKKFLEELRDTLKSNIGISESKQLNDDEYFMGITGVSALRSKDPSTQVGACLVDSQNRILSIGYNGAPYGMDDDFLPWNSLGETVGDLLTTKNPYVVHAEINAFDNYKGNQDDLYKSKLYLIYSPCVDCSKRISIAGLDKVIYLREYIKNDTLTKSNIWLNSAGTLSQTYFVDSLSKEECLKFFEETTKVIKKNLKK